MGLKWDWTKPWSTNLSITTSPWWLHTTSKFTAVCLWVLVATAGEGWGLHVPLLDFPAASSWPRWETNNDLHGPVFWLHRSSLRFSQSLPTLCSTFKYHIGMVPIPLPLYLKGTLAEPKHMSCLEWQFLMHNTTSGRLATRGMERRDALHATIALIWFTATLLSILINRKMCMHI